MRTFGKLCSMLSAVGGSLLIGLIYAVDDDIRVMRQIQGESLEGWSYWLAHPSELKALACTIGSAVLSALLPILALWRSSSSVTTCRPVDWAVFILAVLVMVVLSSWTLWEIHQGSPLWFLFIPASMLSGCVYASIEMVGRLRKCSAPSQTSVLR